MRLTLNEKKLVNFLIAEISIPAIKYFIVQSVPGWYVYNRFANMIVSLILIAFLIPALMVCFCRSSVKTCIFLFLAFSVILFQVLLFPENRQTVIEYLPKIFGMSVGCFIVSYNLRDYETFYKRLVEVSYYMILFATLEFYTHTFLGVVGTEKANYDMSFVYFLVVPTAVIFDHIYDLHGKRKAISIFFFVTAISIGVLMGARGGILAIMLAVLITFMRRTEIRKTRTFLFVLIMSVAIVLLLINYEMVLLRLNRFLIGYGINSRLINLFLRGRLIWSAGRDVIQEQIRDIIKEHVFTGIGMLGNQSSHNIFLEVMLFYGVPVGLLLTCFIIVQWTKVFFVCNQLKKRIMYIFLAYSLIDSTLNLTVLGKDMFWISLGLAFSEHIRLKSHTKAKFNREMES